MRWPTLSTPALIDREQGERAPEPSAGGVRIKRPQRGSVRRKIAFAGRFINAGAQHSSAKSRRFWQQAAATWPRGRALAFRRARDNVPVFAWCADTRLTALGKARTAVFCLALSRGMAAPDRERGGALPASWPSSLVPSRSAHRFAPARWREAIRSCIGLPAPPPAAYQRVQPLGGWPGRLGH